MKRDIAGSGRRFRQLTLILVAVVFALGTIFVPADIYAAEEETVQADSTVSEEQIAGSGADPDAAEQGTEGYNGLPGGGAANAEVQAEETDGEGTAGEAAVDVLSDSLTTDLDSLDESEYNGFIYKLEDSTTNKEIKEMESAIDNLAQNQEVSELVEKEVYTADSIETIAEVVQPEMVEYIEPDYVLKALGSDDYYYDDYGWYLEATDVPYIWDKGMTGSGTTVAVLDSGIKASHEEFADTNFTDAYNAITGQYGIENVNDDFGHGTKVTGVIAAASNNGKGLAGIMPDAAIMPVKVLNENGLGTVSAIVGGIGHAMAEGADVINMSFGGSFNGNPPVSLQQVCAEAASRGIILVAAAGNNGNSELFYPASYNDVISVGSVDSSSIRSSFSNYNNKISVVAPGEGLCMPSITRYTDCYGNSVYYTSNETEDGRRDGSGTSFTAPQVSALALMAKSLMRSKYDRNLSPTEFSELIRTTSIDKGTAGYDIYYGYGLINFRQAYDSIAAKINYYTFTLSSSQYVYTGAVRTPSVSVTGKNKLANHYYKVTYASGRKAVGKYKVTITGINGYTGTVTKTFNIVPPLVKGIKSPKRAKKKLTVRWTAMSKSQKKKYKNVITGYQVRVSTSSRFTGAKYKTVKGMTKTQAAVTGLKKKTTYYVQYRAYKTVNGTSYYSKWSSTKKAKTK